MSSTVINSSDGSIPSRRLVVLISGSGTSSYQCPESYHTHCFDPLFIIGTNLQALIDAQNTPALPHTSIVLVLSNRKAAHGLTRASSANPPIPTAYLGLQPYLRQNAGKKTREDYDLEIARIVLGARPDAIVLAGWMHIVSEAFLEVLKGARALPPRERKEREGKEEGQKNNVDGEEDLTPLHPIPVINIHPALPGQFDGANAIQRGYDAFQCGEVDKLGVMVHRVVAEVDRGEPLVVREVPIERGEPIEIYEQRLHQVEWEIIVQATKRVLDEVKPLPQEVVDENTE